MSDELLRGRAWVGGKDIYAFDMIPSPVFLKPIDAEELSRIVMSGVSPEFEAANAFQRAGYSFVVAGSNFAGGGKSPEHPIVGLMAAGIKAVIADSFSRLQFRNAINRGLPFITCKGIRGVVATGDELEVDLRSGLIRNLTSGKETNGAPIPQFVSEVAEAGGLIGYARKQIAEGKL